jgi:hypothetical protein
LSKPRLSFIPPVLIVCAIALCTAVAVQAADPPRYKTYYKIFDRGGALIPGKDSQFVPQGLAYWPEQDALVISYYDSKGGKSRLAIIDRGSGAKRKILVLNTDGHVGGLAMTKNYLWVANNGKAVRYAKSKLASAKELALVKATSTYPIKASSYMTVRANKMWVGQFNDHANGTAYRYTIGAGEKPVYDGVSFATPSQVQGMAVTSRNVIWSRSYGRDNDSLIDIRPVGAPNGTAIKAVVAPNMSEGLAIAGSTLHVVYESGSAAYADADYRVKTVHHAPLSKLGGA